MDSRSDPISWDDKIHEKILNTCKIEPPNEQKLSKNLTIIEETYEYEIYRIIIEPPMPKGMGFEG